jgi:hypothetical protein
MHHPNASLLATDRAPGVRAFLNRHPVATGVGIITVASLCLFRSFRPAPAPKAYYTVDDGTTFFADTVQLPPFMRDGKEAVGAMVYKCDENGSFFVGYLYRYTPEGKARNQAALDQHRGGPPIGMEVKRPGVGNWVAAMDHGTSISGASVSGAQIAQIRCPNGNGIPMLVNPQ